ncbi:20310_t:CDS:2 [Funneliformis geosporum]|nr:20310_t:CDS:2 [Funneliformis geosporum]
MVEKITGIYFGMSSQQFEVLKATTRCNFKYSPLLNINLIEATQKYPNGWIFTEYWFEQENLCNRSLKNIRWSSKEKGRAHSGKASKYNRRVVWKRLANKIEERILETASKENRRAYFGNENDPRSYFAEFPNLRDFKSTKKCLHVYSI